MSNLTLSIPEGILQSQADVLGPGIAGLFIQGLLTGLVLAQFCRWYSNPERNDGVAFSVLVVFVTMVGLAQTGIVFASTWSKYVKKFGLDMCPDWSDYTQPLPSLFIAVPIQALMIRRCYYIIGKNVYILTLLVILLITSTALTLWSIAQTLRILVEYSGKAYLEIAGTSYPYMMSLVFPSILDITLSGILLHYLMRTMKHVYAPHMRRRLAGLMNVVWKSAIPPTLCTIFLCVLYIQFATTPAQKKLEFWYPAIQGVIGKLYVLSLFYIINDDAPRREMTTAFVPTLTVPIDIYDTFSLDTRVGGGIACSQCTVPPTPAMSANTAV